jgi:hypothetical protein
MSYKKLNGPLIVATPLNENLVSWDVSRGIRIKTYDNVIFTTQQSSYTLQLAEHTFPNSLLPSGSGKTLIEAAPLNGEATSRSPKVQLTSLGSVRFAGVFERKSACQTNVGALPVLEIK